MARISSAVITCSGALRNAGRTASGGFDATSSGSCRRVAYGSCHASIANSPAWPTCSQIDAPAWCTASTIGAIRSTRSRVWTRVMPGDERPSS